jgi:inorganic triphosphatase YgiF
MSEGPNMADARELEIKLRLDPKDIEMFSSLEALGSSKPSRARLHTVYFDDPRRRLAEHGLELRVRTAGDRHLQTVKAGSGTSRGEWESQIADEAPSRESAAATPAKRYLKKQRPLEPVFDVKVERRSWKVARNGSEAAISLDSGEIACGRRKQSLAEAEFELKGGSPRLLFELAEEAIRRCDAPLSFVGKGLRGRRLAQGISDSPEQQIDLRLEAEATAESAFQQIVAACLQQASINEELLRQRPESVEAVHGMRIAMRRLRAALSMFAEMIEGDDLGRLKQELKWISDLLGAARDLDVLVAGPVRNVRLRHPDLEGLEELRDKSEELRQAAHRGLNEAIHSERFRRLLLAVVEFAHAGAWSRDASPERRKLRNEAIVAFAPDELDRRLRSVCKKKSRFAIVGENELDRHRVRIKAKKLRYTAEFLKSLARNRDYEKTSGALKELQSTLGKVHDAVAAEQIVSRILEKENSADLAFAASILRGEFAAPASSIEKASAAHAQLRRSTPFWRRL